MNAQRQEEQDPLPGEKSDNNNNDRLINDRDDGIIMIINKDLTHFFKLTF